MSVLAKLREYRGTQQKPTYQTKEVEDPRYEPKIAKVEKQEFKPFTPGLPFIPTAPVQERLSFNQPKVIESDLPITAKVTAPITGKTLGLENVKTYQAPIGQSKKELDAKDKAEKKQAKETSETLEKELTKKYGFKVKRANSPIEYANILLKVPANQKEEFKKDYDAYILAVERSNPFRAGAESGFNILPTNLEKTKGKEVVEEAKGFGTGRFVGGAGQQLAFNSVLGAPIEGFVGKVLPKATPFITETIKDVAIGTGTQLAEAPFDKPTAGQFVGNMAMDIALNALFGAIGKGLSKIDLTTVKTAKPQGVVQEVAKQMDINEQQASDLIDKSIDVYVNQYGVADTKPFEQLQLPSPKNISTDTTAINLRQPKKPDVYVNQFGVADTKPFEQLQLDAPKNIVSDTSAVNLRLPKKVQQTEVPKKFQRIEEPGVTTRFADTSEKPQGLYLSDSSIVSPHQLGGNKTEFELNKNAKVLNVATDMFESNRGPVVGESAGIAAARKYVGDAEVKRMMKTNKQDLINELTEKYPNYNWSLQPDQHMMVEGVGAIEARKDGYDGIWAYDKYGQGNDTNEFVALNENAIKEPSKQVVKPSLPQDFTIQKPQYPPLAKDFARETVTPKITPQLKPQKVFDEKKPVFYHGTGSEFEKFEKEMQGGNYRFGESGFFFTNNQKTAGNYAKISAGNTGGKERIIVANLDVKNPLVLGPYDDAVDFYDLHSPDILSEVELGMHDGVVIKSTDGKRDLHVVFEPEQIIQKTEKIKPILKDITIQKPTYPKMQPEFTKERPSVLQPGDVKPTLKADEVVDHVLKKFRLDLFGATPEKPVNAVVEGKPVNVVGVKNNMATLSDGTNVAVKNVAMPKAKIEPALKPKQVDFEKETLSAKTETVANGEIKERGFSENIRTDKNRVDELRQEFDQNKEFYETLSNKSTLESAQARFDRGYEEAIKDFRATSDTIRADNVPLAKLIADEATKRGDMEVAREVVVKAAESLTKAGQFSQAAKILRESNDPITIMQFVNKEIKKLNNQGSTRYGNKWDNIKLDENELNLIAKISKDATDEEKEEVFKQIFDSISKRIPTTKREQFDAWRRIAMLFNPKTHVRNTLGNTLMKGLKLISDKTAQAMELTLPKDIRTKGFATKELKETAKTYFDSNKKTLLEGSRWDIFGVASPFSEKQIFKNQFLESLNEISKKTLEGEDIFFFKSNFINDLAGFMNARGLKEPTEEAVQYALRRSQEATFRQANEVANAINKLKGSRIGLLVDAAIPFTKTPANILKTGIDYSPIGAMKSVVEILNKDDPATAIENLSKGLTGTGLALIGAWASANGLARGDYEKKANVEGLYQATGMLPNSIKTPGGSYTIDWAQPIAMPFFMGVAFMDELKKGGQSKADAAFNALLQSGESLVNQSMLSGVKDLFGGYGTMTEKIIQLPINYMTQGFPTVSGQIARVIDPYKRQIDYSNIIDSTITSLQAKTPLLTKELPVKRDILGKQQEYGKGLLNVFQQFLSPGFIGKETDDPVIKEISRLYESVGSDVLPKAKVTDFSNEKIKYNLTTKEISEVQRIMGEYTNKQLLSLMNSYDYKNATDTERAKMVKKANETGYELAKKTIVEARKK